MTIVIFKLEISLKNVYLMDHRHHVISINHFFFLLIWLAIKIFDTDKKRFSTKNGRKEFWLLNHQWHLKFHNKFMTSYHKLKLTLSCWLQNPFLFRGIFMSILALTIVILDVTKKMWHRPEKKCVRIVMQWRF